MLGKWVVPGSSLAGPVRSLHEALTGSCLRVVDEEFLPVHRDPAVALARDWRLAVVTASPGGLAARLCHPAVWARRTDFPLNLNPDTSQTYHRNPNPLTDFTKPEPRRLVEPNAFGTSPIVADPAGEWITLVRPPLVHRVVDPQRSKRNKGKRDWEGTLRLPLAKLSKEVLPVSAEVHAAYSRAAEYSEDVRLKARDRLRASGGGRERKSGRDQAGDR
ncbi:MAG: hypothetical protein ACOYEV_13285 [Candidatus Nanopelagicales bacterium]